MSARMSRLRGILPFVERTSGGIRMFKEQDYEWMKIIECMKRAGMPIKDIRDYIELALEGDATIHERLQLFQNQKLLVQEQMKSLQHTLDVLDYKCWYYETAEWFHAGYRQENRAAILGNGRTRLRSRGIPITR